MARNLQPGMTGWLQKRTERGSSRIKRVKDMAEIETYIVDATARLARRINIRNMLRFVSLLILWGAGASVALVFVSKFVMIPIPLALTVFSVLVICLAVGVIRGMLARVSPLEAAMMADVRVGLKERLSSAVELMGEEDRSEMAELQLEDAAEHARSLDPKSVCPRVFPLAAKVLPLSLLFLITLFYVPNFYGGPGEVPAVVRQAIKQAGADMEDMAGEMDKNPLAEEVADLASEVGAVGSELRDKPMTKKEALRNLSNLARKMETLKIIGKVSEELDSDMTPEKKRILNELLERLADSLKDLPDMAGIFQKVAKAQQVDLSVEALKELAAALEQIGMGDPDMKALQQMSEQVAKGKRDIGRVTLAAADSSELTGEQEESSGPMGGGAPGRDTARVSEEYGTRAPIPIGQRDDLELEGQPSEGGRSVPVESELDVKKGESVMPYEEIYAKYRDAADDAVSRANIPWTYREHVKNYFDAIRPESETR